MNDEERRRRLEELLKPEGELLGEPPARKGSKVRRVRERDIEAVYLFSHLAVLGHKANLPTYPGLRIELPALGYVGYRAASKSGEPTIDVNVRIGGLRDVKFKYVGHSA